MASQKANIKMYSMKYNYKMNIFNIQKHKNLCSINRN